MWHSSGNWTRTSQPQVPPGPNPTIYRLGNREWHSVIRDEPLSRLFETYIPLGHRTGPPATRRRRPRSSSPSCWSRRRRCSTWRRSRCSLRPSRPFHLTKPAPADGVRVRPLMTPDNFAPEMIALIDSAQHTLFMQHSYVNAPRNPDRYRDLVAAVGRRMQAGVDVRVITGKSLPQADLDLLIGLGWKISCMRRMTSPLHNKGFPGGRQDLRGRQPQLVGRGDAGETATPA
jgi:phosphatidylserine/phosphatidylglycerophosphate/cardiolipin synthase-like enzyme